MVFEYEYHGPRLTGESSAPPRTPGSATSPAAKRREGAQDPHGAGTPWDPALSTDTPTHDPLAHRKMRLALGTPSLTVRSPRGPITTLAVGSHLGVSGAIRCA